MSEAGPGGRRLYMDATVRANRALSRKGLYVLLGVVAAMNLIQVGVLLAIGAWPVPFFVGLDLVGLLVAFAVSNRRSERCERVQVCADEVRVAYEDRRVSRTVWTSPTAFTRVDLERPTEHEARVRLRLRDQAISLGRSLSPAERAEFGRALQSAIASARAERWS